MSFDTSTFFLKLRFDVAARILFYETLRDFVREEVAAYEVIRRIEQSATHFKTFPAEVLRSIMESMRGSRRGHDASLGSALQPWTPSMESSLISAGERMGQIDVALHEAARLLRAHQRIRGILISKLPYPLILMIMLAGVLMGIGGMMIPLLEQIMPREQWGAVARLMGFLADNSLALTVLMLGGTAVFLTGFLISAPRWTGKTRDFLDRHVLPWTLYRELQGSMALMTISMLTNSGVPMGAAFELLRSNASPWMQDHMARIMMRMRSGKSESFALASHDGKDTMFSAYTAWQISLYSANANMATKLRALSETCSNDVEAAIGRFAGAVQSLMMVLVAAMMVLTYVSYMSVTSAASAGVTGL